MAGDPAPMSALVPVTPRALERLVERCLEKDPEDRWQSMRDVVLELRSIAESGAEAPEQAVAQKRTVRFLWPGIAALFALVTAANLVQLRQLEEKHRMFELRDLLDQPTENSAEVQVYRAIINSRFGHEREAVGQFRAFLATQPIPEMERKARYELANALTRIGECGGAARELEAALHLTAGDDTGRADIENARLLLTSLSGVAAQTVEFGPPAPIQARRNELGLWTVPVEMNSQRGEWILDTGASLSTVTESEARRMGLTIRETHGYALGYSAAPSIHIMVKNGNIRLEGVVANAMDKQIAGMRAKGVSGAFDVQNDLQVEGK